ncbi:ATP-grasp fold amidoligase family protein [Allohahella marinimesophila]|uniref:ATP-grasp fold amidoligase family protein n=1 Tax=Allohahella marinimesophila TaxID=1054972 RepID=A0ABP7Q3W2_9GAMM
MLTKVLASVLQSLPKTRTGDYIFSYMLFLRAHKRKPGASMLLNDYLFRLKTSNEMLSPLRQFTSDKALVKHFVAATVGDQYNIESIAVLESKDQVDSYKFPNTCCIKPTHGSGRVILRRNGEPIDKAEIKAWFDLNYYLYKREINYRYAQPKVIIEPILFGGTKGEDYKFFCYEGKVKLLQVDIGRHDNHTRKYYDGQMNEQDFSMKRPRELGAYELPKNMAEMIAVAEKLSSYFGFVRIDLYSDGNAIYVGEITHCPENACARFIPVEAEQKASDLIFN